MADKEATIYIVDVARSMGRKTNGRQISDLDWAMLYIWDRMTSTVVATDRKTATLGVLGLRTDVTSNELGGEESFANISVFQEIKQTLLPDLQHLRDLVKPSKTNHGDAISAVVIAIQMITKFCRKLKYRRKIVLVTNGQGLLDPEDLSDITAKIKEDKIELVILGVDFDDLQYHYKEENKDPQKAKNEASFKALADDCDGTFGTLAQAIEELGIPRLKITKPVTSYKEYLTLGHPTKYPETLMCIDVERYPRTMVRKPAGASNFVQHTNTLNGQASTASSAAVQQDTDLAGLGDVADQSTSLVSVKYARTYQVDDLSGPGGKRDVEKDDLARGYEYGRTAVYISEADEGVTKLATEAALEILGFIPWDKYDRYMSMSSTSVIIGQKTNDKAIMALSSVIHALFELESYAIARFVSKAGKPPVLLLLAPSIELDYECLLDVQIPFAEDVRSYKFPTIGQAVTVSGKTYKKETRNLPNEQLISAMDKYVDSLDLSELGRDDEGKPAEYMPMTDTYSPVLHRIDQAVRWRAVHPTEPIPPPYEVLIRYSKIPDALEVGSKAQLTELISVAELKKVPPKIRGKRKRDHAAPASGLDVSALLASSRTADKISFENPIPEFRQMLETTEDPNGIIEAATQFSAIIEKHIVASFGDSMYSRALEEMDVLRGEMLEMEEPQLWNTWLRELKDKLLQGNLGEGREELWWKMRKERLGLISHEEEKMSDVTEEEAKLFLSSR